MNMQLAFYKGPAKDLAHKIAHWAVCFWTRSPYSHCELVIDGVCYSSSTRDGGVRSKEIDLASGNWDLVPVQGDLLMAMVHFRGTKGLPYDWAGVMRFVFPWLPNPARRWYCSEWCAAALGWEQIELSPQELYSRASSLLHASPGVDSWE